MKENWSHNGPRVAKMWGWKEVSQRIPSQEGLCQVPAAPGHIHLCGDGCRRQPATSLPGIYRSLQMLQLSPEKVNRCPTQMMNGDSYIFRDISARRAL